MVNPPFIFYKMSHTFFGINICFFHAALVYIFLSNKQIFNTAVIDN